MLHVGWSTDRPLTLRTAKSVVRAAVPEAAADSLEWVGSGWEFDAYRTSDDWVFRFPRRSDAVPPLEREGPILNLACSVLPPSVSVPLVDVVHHDVPVSPEHLLADAETGRLVGILDWTDAILGDTARDFVPLVAFAGWGFVDEVLRHYPRESMTATRVVSTSWPDSFLSCGSGTHT